MINLSLKYHYMSVDSSIGESVGENPTAARYSVTYIDASTGKLILADVDDPNNLALLKGGQLITPDSPGFGKNVISIYQTALVGEQVERLLNGKKTFTLDELLKIQTLVKKGSSYASRAHLVRQRYGSELQQKRFSSVMEKDLPSLTNLLACVNSQLPVDEFVEMLICRLC